MSSSSNRLIFAATAIAALAACSTSGTMGATGMGGTSARASAIVATDRSDANTVALLHAANMSEITAGMMAQQRGSDTAVRSYAGRMVQEHTMMDQQMMQMVSQLGITPALPDSQLPRMAQRANQRLSSTTAGQDFDRRYIQQQVAMHTEVLALVDNAITIAQRPELRTMLQSQARPSIAMHLNMATTIQGRIGQP